MYYNEDGPGTFGEATVAPNDPVYQKTYPMPVPATWNEPINKEGRPSAHWEYNGTSESMVGPTPATEAKWKSFRNYYFNLSFASKKYSF